MAATAKAVCPKCGASEWGTRNRCRPCERKKARAKRAADPTTARAKDRAKLRAWRKANPDKVRAQKLRADYSLSPADYDALVAAQNGRCAICKSAKLECIDHCHTTGRVRGVLCRACNAALGQFRDNPDLFVRGAEYLERSDS